MMTGFNETIRGFGHGVERIVMAALEGRDSEEICPDVPESQTFQSVFERNDEFIRQKTNEVALGEPPTEERKSLEKVPAIPDVLNNEPAQSPFALGIAERKDAKPRKSTDEASSSQTRRSSNESEKKDKATPMRDFTVRNGAESALRRASSDGSRDSLDTRQRGSSIELGHVNPRNLRTAVQLGERPRTESQSLGMVDEIIAGGQGRVVRRRIVLPYQITLIFGIASIVGAGIGVGILVISVRNAVFLRGPKAGPQLPEIKDLALETNAKLSQILNLLPRRLRF